MYVDLTAACWINRYTRHCFRCVQHLFVQSTIHDRPRTWQHCQAHACGMHDSHASHNIAGHRWLHAEGLTTSTACERCFCSRPCTGHVNLCKLCVLSKPVQTCASSRPCKPCGGCRKLKHLRARAGQLLTPLRHCEATHRTLRCVFQSDRRLHVEALSYIHTYIHTSTVASVVSWHSCICSYKRYVHVSLCHWHVLHV